MSGGGLGRGLEPEYVFWLQFDGPVTGRLITMILWYMLLYNVCEQSSALIGSLLTSYLLISCK